ncbi:MAG: hypothetical protein RL033_1832, partial [Pseudomonadota bacterium]
PAALRNGRFRAGRLGDGGRPDGCARQAGAPAVPAPGPLTAAIAGGRSLQHGVTPGDGRSDRNGEGRHRRRRWESGPHREAPSCECPALGRQGSEARPQKLASAAASPPASTTTTGGETAASPASVGSAGAAASVRDRPASVPASTTGATHACAPSTTPQANPVTQPWKSQEPGRHSKSGVQVSAAAQSAGRVQAGGITTATQRVLRRSQTKPRAQPSSSVQSSS